jgi:hypothetical protein
LTRSFIFESVDFGKLAMKGVGGCVAGSDVKIENFKMTSLDHSLT